MNKFKLNVAITAHQEAIASIISMEKELLAVGTRLRTILETGGRVFICGNGGSAADAQHFAAELTGRFERERRGYPAVALTTDSSALTAIGNDYGFDFIFSRQLEALGQQGDMLIAISTSGNSINVLKAVEYARANRIYSVGLLGRDGGKLATQVDAHFTILAAKTARIQEAHIFILHLLCEMVDENHGSRG